MILKDLHMSLMHLKGPFRVSFMGILGLSESNDIFLPKICVKLIFRWNIPKSYVTENHWFFIIH